MLLFKIYLENYLVKNVHIRQRPVGILFIEQWSSHDHYQSTDIIDDSWYMLRWVTSTDIVNDS
jgi:hypothetical protein